MNSELFAKLPPTKLFFRCAVPAVITSVFCALYSVVDGVFVGKYLGEDALAAINLIMPIIMIVEAISNMTATGASVNMSMLLGQHKREEASRVFSFSVKFILIFSFGIGLLGFFFARPFVTLISPGASENAIMLSTEYLRVYSLFAPLIPIYFATDNYLRVCGREKLSMILNVTSQFANVILDFILIAVLHQGVKAAAIASCVSISSGSLVSLFLFMGKRMDVYYTKENIPIPQFFSIIANGSSEFFSSIATSVMSVVMNLFLLKYGGTTAVAAFSIVMYVDSIIGMMNFGICDSLQPAISYCYGAGMPERMRAIFRRVITATITVSAVSFLFMLFIGPHAAVLFIKESDTELLKVSITAIKLFSFSYLVGWIDMCFSSLFTALDRPGRSLLVSLFGTLLFPIIFLFLLTAVWGLDGVWLMASIAALASGILTLFLFKTMRIKNT
ncbi:MAG: MATE family efflux transporter [Ruminococcus sp.]|uniref:MATE family efflux transporter n=1 Tax=Ruminococcus sp. TaxID=41978 RepID=UPI0025EBE914|nr:MATE family efflux transporter [Ruminococcus sp.]MBR5684161.1 MATE family efflux transporter [Ruminococcus sp.]